MRLFRSKKQARGYTLMELVMAAMVALLVIAGLYVVYAGHAQVFRGQEMVSQAQVTARFAMEVLKSDIQRAGAMGVSDTNDAQVKQVLCAQPALGRIQAITLDQGIGEVVNPDENIYSGSDPSIRPTQAPDRLTLVGNYTHEDEFWVDRIVGSTVTLQNNTLTDPTDPYPPNAQEFDAIFNSASGVVNVARISHQNKVFFSAITAAAFGGTVTIADSPGCLPGLWDGARLNIINKIQYSVVPAELTAAEETLSSGNPAIANRLDLVRDVLDWSTDDVVTRQVVAENVVDFQVWFLFDAQESPAIGPSVSQGITPFPDEDTGGAPCGSGVIGVDSECAVPGIHGAIIRLSVRTPREDPKFMYPTDVVRPLQWYEVDPDSVGAARVRTLVHHFAIPNIGYGS